MNETLKTFVGWLGIIGIPSIFTMTMWCIKSCVTYTKQLRILMDATQAQMRSNLLMQYKNYINAGYVELDDLDDWENQYQKYHMLGANGVMDSKRDELLKLPNVKPN